MKQGIARLMGLVHRLHRSEQGAEGLEKLLIVAAVVLPLLGLLIFFRQTISDWVSQQWTKVAEDSQNQVNTPSTPTGVSNPP